MEEDGNKDYTPIRKMSFTQYLQLDGTDETKEKKETNFQIKVKKILRAISFG